jgi:hypothetical protein
VISSRYNILSYHNTPDTREVVGERGATTIPRVHTARQGAYGTFLTLWYGQQLYRRSALSGRMSPEL